MNRNTIEAAYRKIIESDFEAILPDSGFLREYHDFALPLTEAPAIYHLFVAFALLAAACARHVHLPFGAQRLYPNLWLILIAPSSRLKKSTALSLGRRILAASKLDVIYPNEFSREAMIEILEQKPDGLFLWNELGGVLRAFESNYMLGTKEMLTELFDCPPQFKRVLKSKEVIITDPCISIASASTVDWLNRAVKEHDIRGGFLPRFIYIPADKPSKLLPLPPTPDPEAQAAIVQRLEQIAAYRGVFGMSADAEAIHDNWYHANYGEMSQEIDSETLAPFYSRLSVYLLKFAMLYELSATGDFTISAEAMHSACLLVDQLKANIKHLVDTDLLQTYEETLTRKVLTWINRRPGISRSELLRTARVSTRSLEPILQALLERGEISVIPNPGRSPQYVPIAVALDEHAPSSGGEDVRNRSQAFAS